MKRILIGAGIFGVFFLMSKQLNADPSVNKSFDELFKKFGSKFGFDWKILKRIAWIESKVGTYKSVKRGIENPRDIAGSVSSDGLSWGIMQTTVSTAKDYDKSASPEKLNNPEFSISMGAAHLNFIIRNYFRNERDIVMAYNHGQGNQKRFIELEKSGKLKSTEFLAGRDYWNKYLEAKRLIP